MVEADHLREASLEGQVFEAADDVVAAKRKADFQRQALPREVIHDIHCSDRSAVGQAIVHEVHGPTFIRASRRRNRCSANVANLTLLSRPDLKSIGSVYPQEAIVAHGHLIALE